MSSCASCILSKFYIKPQLILWPLSLQIVVSYRNSTSNHNSKLIMSPKAVLYLIEILHQTTTGLVSMKKDLALYLIEILHQTTTELLMFFLVVPLYLIEILHQTTTESDSQACSLCCILSKFYIKPQPLFQGFDVS